MPDAALRLDRVTKRYGALTAVSELSLDVQPGEMFGLIGPDGAGKTTTIRLLLYLLRPTRGHAAVLVIDCHRDSLAARRQIAPASSVGRLLPGANCW